VDEIRVLVDVKDANRLNHAKASQYRGITPANRESPAQSDDGVRRPGRSILAFITGFINRLS
jgi:hypothetical protein